MDDVVEGGNDHTVFHVIFLGQCFQRLHDVRVAGFDLNVDDIGNLFLRRTLDLGLAVDELEQFLQARHMGVPAVHVTLVTGRIVDRQRLRLGQRMLLQMERHTVIDIADPGDRIGGGLIVADDDLVICGQIHVDLDGERTGEIRRIEGRS